MKPLKNAKELDELRSKLAETRDPSRPAVIICSGTACEACKSDLVAKAFEKELAGAGLEGKVEIRRTGCHGFCERGPIVMISPSETLYISMKDTDVPEVVAETLVKGNTVERLLFQDPATAARMAHTADIPFYKNQLRVIIGDNTKIDPTSIDDYIAIGGYGALAKALTTMKPEDVLNEVKIANLRGRGGGGFPAGRKWETTRKAPGEPKYVIVNGDEGDPGAYMDRSLLEGNPHGVLEGLILGAYAIGAAEGFFYVRKEYPLASTNTKLAIRMAHEYGLLGKNILGSGFDFDVKLHHGAGAFVSGESSALMTAIEGRVGEPRSKYIHTSEKGLYDRPSCLNNVETWANVPHIINKGAAWFTSLGTEGSKGTKIFSLVGKVNNTGLVEVPMGITLREIVFDIGGGVKGGGKFKAVQTGGPSGGCIPESLMDLPVDFDKLTEAGSMMGSGGIIVMDEHTCMVDVARYYTEFLANESCGKCVPCREGLRNTARLLDKIATGKGENGDVEMILELADLMSEASLCALGKTAANPVLTTIKYFRDEYDAHINEKRCPAKVCRELITFQINAEKCKACGLCIKACPADAITGAKKTPHVIDQAKCVKCGGCLTACPPKFGAVEKIDAVGKGK